MIHVQCLLSDIFLYRYNKHEYDTSISFRKAHCGGLLQLLVIILNYPFMSVTIEWAKWSPDNILCGEFEWSFGWSHITSISVQFHREMCLIATVQVVIPL